MTHYIFVAEEAAGFPRSELWEIDAAEPHRDALAVGDLVLVYLGAPDRSFIGRAEIAEVHPGGALLAQVEEWDPPVPIRAVLARIDSSAAKADFDNEIVLISASEYEAALAVAARPVEVEFREITRETVRAVCALRVADGQQNFVADNSRSIAEAHFEPRHWMRAIYAAGEPAGLALAIEDAGEGLYYLWRFMVDERFQRRGVGRRAMELLLDRWRALGAREGKLSVVDENHGAIALYEGVGFRSTGEYVHGELVMEVNLSEPHQA